MTRKKLAASVAICLGLFLLMHVGCGRGVDPREAVALEKAQAAFDRASTPDDFLKAASMYDSIRRDGLVSGAMLYNQGNALMKAGRRGLAVAAYREAVRYRPGDPNLKAALDNALGENDDVRSRRPLIGYLFFWQDWISYPAKFQLAAVAAVIAFLLALANLFLRNRLLRRLAAAGLVLTLIFGLSAAYDWHRFDYVKHGVVIDAQVVARKGNAAGYQPAFTEPLVEGTEFTVVDRRGSWLLIRLLGDGAREGWIEDKSAAVY